MSDTRTSELVINKLSKQQYDNIQNPSDTELYLVPEDEEHKPICYPTTASEVKITSMVLKSSVDGNGRMLTENGFVYNTSGNPTVSDTKVVCDLVSGIISTHITGLTGSTQYYIRSYGINVSGTTYGDVLTVTTLTNPIPAEYQLVEYLISYQNNYIDTGYKPNKLHTIIVDNVRINWSGMNNNNPGGAFGCSQTNVTPQIRCDIGWNFRAYIQVTQTSVHNVFPINNNSKFIITPNYIYINEYKFINNMAGNSVYNFYLFARNTNGSINGYFYGAIGSFIVIDENNQYVRRMYPVYRISDNIPGMYDIANGVFYTNAGTGNFIVGPDKEFDE